MDTPSNFLLLGLMIIYVNTLRICIIAINLKKLFIWDELELQWIINHRWVPNSKTKHMRILQI